MTGWRKLPFDAVMADESRGNPKIPQSAFLSEGRYAIVDQGKALIAGFTNDKTRLCHAQLPVIVFGDHTRCFKYVDFPFCMGADGTKVLRPIIDADLKYLYHYLRQINLTAEGYARHYKYLRRKCVALPPLSEQVRIASILDKAEAIQLQRRLALDELDTLTRAIFVDLFGAYSQTPVTVGDCLLPHPNGWRWRLLTDVARLATGHTPDRQRPDYWGGNIPWIALNDIRILDGSIAHDTEESVTELGIENSSAVILPAGTVCFSRTASVGFATVMGEQMATSQDFVNWVCGPNLNPLYLLHALLMSRHRLRALSAGSTHKTIYFPTVERFRVLVPPLELQQEFASKVGELSSMKTQYRAASATAESLFLALRQRAMSGAL